MCDLGQRPTSRHELLGVRPEHLIAFDEAAALSTSNDDATKVLADCLLSVQYWQWNGPEPGQIDDLNIDMVESRSVDLDKNVVRFDFILAGWGDRRQVERCWVPARCICPCFALSRSHDMSSDLCLREILG